MKKIYILLLVFAIHTGISAQEIKEQSWGFGFQLNQFQSDFGVGLNVISPKIKNSIQIRLKGNLMFNEHLYEAETVWSNYANVMLGISSASVSISDNINLYGEGGVIAIFPNAKFSSEDVDFGGYGLFGFEFYFVPSFNYFIELGGIGTGAVEDKIISKPIYSNGFMISVGWRIIL